jgi:hypothetical protein
MVIRLEWASMNPIPNRAMAIINNTGWVVTEKRRPLAITAETRPRLKVFSLPIRCAIFFTKRPVITAPAPKAVRINPIAK